MIKYYCDMCKKEIDEENIFDYYGNLPTKVQVCEECLNKLKKIEKRYYLKHEVLKFQFSEEIKKILEGKEK